LFTIDITQLGANVPLLAQGVTRRDFSAIRFYALKVLILLDIIAAVGIKADGDDIDEIVELVVKRSQRQTRTAVIKFAANLKRFRGFRFKIQIRRNHKRGQRNELV